MTDELKTLDPDACLDYTWDWTAWLADGETITDADVVSDTLTLDRIGHQGGTVTAWVNPPSPLRSNTMTCRITTSAGRIDDRTITVYVSQR